MKSQRKGAEMERCEECGTILQHRIETDPVSGKSAVKDCPKCFPERFGRISLGKGELTNLPV